MTQHKASRGRTLLAEAVARRSWLAAWSPVELGVHHGVRAALRAHSSGTFLDIGCGTQPFRTVVDPLVDQYIALDIERRSDLLDVLADAHHLPLASDSIDTVLCSEVLEHVQHSSVVFAEIGRVLRPGGLAIVSVPFLSRIHESPHDYVRLTEFGLRALAQECRLRVESLTVTGSLASFLAHQLVSVIVPTAFRVPILGTVIAAAAAITITPLARLVDRAAFPLWRKLPLGYILIVTKPR